MIKVDNLYKSLVPRLTPDQYRSLKNSLEDAGQQVPIIVNSDGVILDGHTRYDILTKWDKMPRIEVKSFETKEDEKQFVITTNLDRRQLTLYGKAEIAFNYYETECKIRHHYSSLHIQATIRGETYKKRERLLNQFARMIGTKPSTCHKIIWLIRNADEETKQLLRLDKTSITKEYYQLKKDTNVKPRSAYGKHLHFPICLNCGNPCVDAEKENCHVHKEVCCKKCGWGC